MYPVFLSIHSILRWLVVITAVLALVRMFSGLAGRRTWTAADDRAGMLFTSMLDLQLVVGIVLYFFLSPTTASLLNGSAGMGNALVRFFAVEHAFLMILGVVAAHVGRALSKKASSDTGKFRAATIGFVLAVILILVAIPWPFSAVSRPWFRLGNFIF